MNSRKLAALCFTVAIGFCATATTVIEHAQEVTKRQIHSREQYNTMLLTFMRGGLSSVESRCILESKYVVEVAPCVKASTPIKGREL